MSEYGLQDYGKTEYSSLPNAHDVIVQTSLDVKELAHFVFKIDELVCIAD